LFYLNNFFKTVLMGGNSPTYFLFQRWIDGCNFICLQMWKQLNFVTRRDYPSYSRFLPHRHVSARLTQDLPAMLEIKKPLQNLLIFFMIILFFFLFIVVVLPWGVITVSFFHAPMVLNKKLLSIWFSLFFISDCN
jgi:hypothetical protein